jgi:NifB/MoaA-like Fe-S oxidoreductase
MKEPTQHEGIIQPEGISEEAVIEALDSGGIEDSEAKKLLEAFVDQCMAEAGREVATEPESAEVSNRANIKAQIKIGRLLSKTKSYKREAAGVITGRSLGRVSK